MVPAVLGRVDPDAWVAPAFRGLATVFHRRELFLPAALLVTLTPFAKFVALEQRDQPTERGRYPDLAVQLSFRSRISPTIPGLARPCESFIT